MTSHILIVDDDLDSRVMLETYLSWAGYKVVTACNGREALECAKALRPALILLDLIMPRMNGRIFRENQLADPEIRDIPVVCLSAHTDAEAIAADWGLAGCIVKPFRLDSVLQTIQRLCGPPDRSPL